MVFKHCCYGTCNSDSRYADRPHMKDVFFINFPKFKTAKKKCVRWVHLFGRPSQQFNPEKVTKFTYICSKHFVGRKGPTEENPDPFPATSCSKQVRFFLCFIEGMNRPLQSKVENIILRNQLNLSGTISPVPAEECRPTLHLSVGILKNDDKAMKFFTGLTYFNFVALTTSSIDELLKCLVRLKRGYCFYTMSFMFKQSESCLRSIFTSCLQLLYCHFNELREVMFPDRSVLKRFMPKSFKSFKNVHCSVDCTEFFVQMPRNFSQQGNLYSNYKHHLSLIITYKCLIAVAPNGTGVFILYEVSDREIFEQCRILSHLNPGDLLLVHRGFTVEDLLMPRHVHVNIPPFLNGREKLTAQEELLTRKIAKARIHVERYNERLNKFKLISGTIPLSLAPLASQAYFKHQNGLITDTEENAA
uniref:THAP-type domain-containing protein n=1 Tax=Fundulus heteroclitus TaxID=8078 RepID=A0A3Q2PLK0_FUNHE